MDLSPESILQQSGSKRVAMAIAAICPDAIFCTFLPTADGRKIPYNRAGRGVSDQTPKEDLYTAQQMAETTEPDGHYWGLYMHEPLLDCFKTSLLTVLDVDMKRTSSSTDIRITKLAKWAKENNHLTERSHSKKGRHVIFLAKQCDAAPKYKLTDHQEIEVFGQPNSPKKSVMLTGDMLSQDELSTEEVDLLAVLDGLGIKHEEQKKTQPLVPVNYSTQSDELSKASNALNFISPDVDYDEWIAIGQALHTEFGHQGLDLWHGWSQRGEKYTGAKDIETHWKSFHAGKGVSMGTLYHMAKQNGYAPPTQASERKSAIEDFMASIKKPEDSQPEAENTTDGWEEFPYSLDHLPAIRYMLDGFFAHGFWVIAGQPGVGKTTALMSLMMIVTGQAIETEVTATTTRKVILVTEDAEQVQRGLFGYARHFKLDPKKITDSVVLIRAKRSSLPELLTLQHNIQKHTLPDGTRPWLILDTANATLEMENENDNSEVGAYMNGLKQTIYTELDTPISIITHLNKQISKTDSEAMARGASAWTGDATGTAVIFTDDENRRYMRLIKRRYEPTFDEVEFSTTTFTALATTNAGDMTETICRVMVPSISSADLRQQRANDQRDDTKQQRAQDKADEACLYVQSVINAHPNGVIIRRGRTAPRTPPSDMLSCHRLELADVFAAVPGSSRGDVKTAVVEAIMRRFAPNTSSNEWVRLGVA